jgi:hypothetical protein
MLSLAYPGEGHMGNCPMIIVENRFFPAELFEKVILPTAMPNRFLDLKQPLPNAQKFLDTPLHVIDRFDWRCVKWFVE